MQRTGKISLLVGGAILLVVLVLVLIQRAVEVQEAAMPDRLDFGTVYQNARVEFDARLLTSARLSPLEQLFDRAIEIAPKSWAQVLQDYHPKRFRTPPPVINLSELKPRVSVPRFLKLTSVHPEQNTNWYQGNPFVGVELLVDTSRTGAFSGKITAVMNRRRSTLPIRFEVKPDTGLAAALVISPFQGTSTEKGDTFEPMVKIMSELPQRTDYLAALPDKLEGYKVILLADSPLARLSDRQVTNLQQSLSNGSRVVVACNYFFRGTVSAANLLTAKYGLDISDTEHMGEEVCTNIVSDSVTRNISTLRFHRASSINVSAGAKALVLNENGSSYAAVSRLPGGGELAVLTQSLWWYWPQQFQTNNDNARFLKNLLEAPQE